MKLLIFLIAIAGCSHTKEYGSNATAMLSSETQRNLTGSVKFTNTKAGLEVEAHVAGLKPNSFHGLHVHQQGRCDGPDYESAGDHYNPEKHQHGAPGKQSHLGDLGNIMADEKGHGKLNLLLTDAGATEFKSLLGRAVLVHAAADDQKSQPAGRSGERIGCGVIVQ